MHAQKCARSSTHDAEPTPDTRGAHAGYSLYVRWLRSSEHLAHTWRTPSVFLTHVQRYTRGPFVPCATTRCAFVGLFNMCSQYALCMRTVYVQCASNTLCIRCQLASFSQIMTKVGRTDVIFHCLLSFQCADRASHMCDWALNEVCQLNSNHPCLFLSVFDPLLLSCYQETFQRNREYN